MTSPGAVIAAFAYAIFLIFLVLAWRRQAVGRNILLAGVFTWIYLLAAASNLSSPVLTSLILVHELAWIVLLYFILRPYDIEFVPVPVRGLVYLSITLVGIALALQWWPATWQSWPIEQTRFGIQLLQASISALGLVLVEQLARNTLEANRWRLRYLAIALAMIFGSSLIMHLINLLAAHNSGSLVDLHAAVLTLTVPLLAIAALRNPDDNLRMSVSRDFVFRLGMLALIAASTLSALIGVYFLHLFAGDLSRTVLALLASATVTVTAVLLGSTKIRRYVKVVITKTLYEYKYDYREQWQRTTQYLSIRSADYGTEQQAVRAIMDVLGCNSGAIWQLSEQQTLLPLVQVECNWNAPITADTTRKIVEYYQHSNWIIDIDADVSVGDEFRELRQVAMLTGARYVIPLFVDRHFTGIAITGDPMLQSKMSWEDYDVLRLVANQAANVLALKELEQLLGNTRQFRAYEQVSAFVGHDVKTVIAQLALLLENAERHRDDPAFISSMLKTVGSARDRLQDLHAQFRNPISADYSAVDLNLVAQLAADECIGPPQASVRTAPYPLVVRANPAQLQTIIHHLINNAIQACAESGSVVVTCVQGSAWYCLTVTDTGCGMEESFIQKRLFKPFESTKGLSGIGIGVYQARHYARSLGGDLSVESNLGAGSQFTLRLPAAIKDTKAGSKVASTFASAPAATPASTGSSSR